MSHTLTLLSEVAVARSGTFGEGWGIDDQERTPAAGGLRLWT